MKKVFFLVLTFVLFVFSNAGVMAASSFPDINGHTYESAINFVFNREIVQGYPDGTYKPDQTLNRAELLKVIVASKFIESDYNSYEGDTCFNDITGTEWYTKYVCFAKAEGIVEGYPDGTFKADQKVNFVEALKIMLLGMGISVPSASGGAWYMPYYNTAASHYLVPSELTNNYTSDFSRGQAAEVIMRILSLDATVVQPAIYTSGGGYEPGSVYIGYMQWANALDLYLIADSGISEYTHQGETLYQIQGNTVLSFDPAFNFNYTAQDGSVTLNQSFTLHTNEIIHVGTVYLDTTNPVTVLSN